MSLRLELCLFDWPATWLATSATLATVEGGQWCEAFPTPTKRRVKPLTVSQFSTWEYNILWQKKRYGRHGMHVKQVDQNTCDTVNVAMSFLPFVAGLSSTRNRIFWSLTHLSGLRQRKRPNSYLRKGECMRHFPRMNGDHFDCHNPSVMIHGSCGPVTEIAIRANRKICSPAKFCIREKEHVLQHSPF